MKLKRMYKNYKKNKIPIFLSFRIIVEYPQVYYATKHFFRNVNKKNFKRELHLWMRTVKHLFTEFTHHCRNYYRHRKYHGQTINGIYMHVRKTSIGNIIYYLSK